MRDLYGMGIGDMTDVILRTDRERAIRKLVRVVSSLRKGRTFPEPTPVGYCQSNALVERAVQSVEGQKRTFKLNLEKKIGEKIK